MIFRPKLSIGAKLLLPTILLCWALAAPTARADTLTETDTLTTYAETDAIPGAPGCSQTSTVYSGSANSACNSVVTVGTEFESAMGLGSLSAGTIGSVAETVGVP